jgi:fatty-acyl-CoA synthase
MAGELLALLQRRLDEAPGAPMLEAGDRRWSRAGFDAEVGATAAALQGQGVAAGSLVAWLGLNSPAMLATLLACARRGAVFLPLNTRLAAAELAAIVRHAGATHLLASPESEAPAQAIREAAGALAAGPVDGLASDDLLLVYTSGTTGRPKGALHTQAGMAANVAAAIDAQGFDRRERVLAVLPLFHVGGLCIQVLPALAAGAVVRLHPRFDPAAWLQDVVTWRPSTSLLVPATIRAVVEHPLWRETDLSSLRFVNSGSQIVPLSLIRAFHARGVPMAQVYGSTETGPVTIVLRPAEAMAHEGQAGRPALGVEVRLVGEQGADVPEGAVGEIAVRAPNLLRRYHRDDGPPPFDAAGWFRTGDLARRDAEGWIEVVGRSKELIISGGENIHPAEIENLALELPGVAEAAVVGVADERWGEVPVLALVPREGSPVDVAALQALFDARLARFKHPRRIVVLPGLPRTALGKVQRAPLQALLAGG